MPLDYTSFLCSGHTSRRDYLRIKWLIAAGQPPSLSINRTKIPAGYRRSAALLLNWHCGGVWD
jgi:hypothetical protein